MSEDTYMTRKFDGKTYHFAALRQTKAQAEKMAKHFRGIGYQARIVKLRGTKAVSGQPVRHSWVYGVYTYPE